MIFWQDQSNNRRNVGIQCSPGELFIGKIKAKSVFLDETVERQVFPLTLNKTIITQEYGAPIGVN